MVDLDQDVEDGVLLRMYRGDSFMLGIPPVEIYRKAISSLIQKGLCQHQGPVVDDFGSGPQIVGNTYCCTENGRLAAAKFPSEQYYGFKG